MSLTFKSHQTLLRSSYYFESSRRMCYFNKFCNYEKIVLIIMDVFLRKIVEYLNQNQNKVRNNEGLMIYFEFFFSCHSYWNLNMKAKWHKYNFVFSFNNSNFKNKSFSFILSSYKKIENNNSYTCSVFLRIHWEFQKNNFTNVSVYHGEINCFPEKYLNS